MPRNTSAAPALYSTEDAYDPEATLTIGPEEKRRMLAEAFRRTDEETTLRVIAPFVPACVPSPIGDDAPLSGERETRPAPPLPGVVHAAPEARRPETSVLGPRTVVLTIGSLVVAGLAAALAFHG